MVKCPICGRYFENLEEHHLIYGRGLRELSEKYGLKKRICRMCHRRIHTIGKLGMDSKKEGQMMFEKECSREEFIKIFGKSWL